MNPLVCGFFFPILIPRACVSGKRKIAPVFFEIIWTAALPDSGRGPARGKFLFPRAPFGWLAPVIFVFRKARRYVRAGWKGRKWGAALPENFGESGRDCGKWQKKIFLLNLDIFKTLVYEILYEKQIFFPHIFYLLRFRLWSAKQNRTLLFGQRGRFRFIRRGHMEGRILRRSAIFRFPDGNGG